MEEPNKTYQYDGNEEEKVSTNVLKCSACGSNLRFDPEKQAMFCEHCGTVSDFEQLREAQEISIEQAFGVEKNWSSSETVMFHCDNCGANVVINKDQTAKSCPFCGTPHVQKTEELGGLKPNAVLPFAFNKEKAGELAKVWAKKKLFAPRSFKKLSADSINGIYTPSFTFDSITTSSYYGRVGKRYTRTVGSGKNRRTETYIRWYNISGVHYDNFDDVLISAGSKMAQANLDKISPFDTDCCMDYDEKFLLGFMAYHYDYEINDCWGVAKTRIDNAIRRSILAKYDHDVVDFLKVSTIHENVTYKYVMLPTYVGCFKFKQKLFNFYINGRSGRVFGKTPKSFWKIALAILGGLAVVAAIVLPILLL